MQQSKVFVVHGRNEELRKSFFIFLRAMGLEPIEWTEAVLATGKPSPYVGEILDKAFAMAQAVIVLLTPDDEVRLASSLWHDNEDATETTLNYQARPNVLFEAGMAFGRNPDHVLLVEIGKVKPFSDIGGRHVIRLDDSLAKRSDLAHRLKVAGCNVKIEGTDWHSTGDFTVRDKNSEDTSPHLDKETDAGLKVLSALKRAKGDAR